jgi:transposase
MAYTEVMGVGIDVSKAKLDVACLRHDRSTTHQIFGNSADGIRDVIKFLKTQKTPSGVPCVLESTGDYHLLAGLMLRDSRFSVKCINPLITRKYTRASVRGAKSDKIDASRLAQIGLIEGRLPAFTDTRETIAAKKLLSTLAHLERVHQQLSGHLQLLEETQKTLKIKGSHADIKRALTCLKRQMKTYKAQIAKTAPEAAAELSNTTPGLSQGHAAALLVALGDKTFGNHDQLVAFVGFDVRVKQSGTWRGKQMLSKRGNGYLRKLLFQIAWGLMMHNAIYKEYYAQIRARGKPYKTCMIAIARKFLRYLFKFYWKKKLVPSPLETTLPSFESVVPNVQSNIESMPLGCVPRVVQPAVVLIAVKNEPSVAAQERPFLTATALDSRRLA